MSQRIADVFGVVPRDQQLVRVRQEIREEAKKVVAGAPSRMVSIPIAKVIGPTTIVNGTTDAPPPPEPEPEKPVRRSRRRGEDAVERKQWARKRLEEDRGASNRELQNECREIFGVGIDGKVLARLRRALGIKPKGRWAEKPAVELPPAPVTLREPEPKPSRPTGEREEIIRDAIQMLVEELPGLLKLTLEIIDGEPHVSYEAAVQRTETGKLKL